MHYLFIYLGKQ